jgi:hypothetical protein
VSSRPRQQAEQRLAAARGRGDRPAEATALTDLGLVLVYEGQAGPALPLLEGALALAGRLGDPGREADPRIIGLSHGKAGRMNG